jgi:hypothetical protein
VNELPPDPPSPPEREERQKDFDARRARAQVVGIRLTLLCVVFALVSLGLSVKLLLDRSWWPAAAAVAATIVGLLAWMAVSWGFYSWQVAAVARAERASALELVDQWRHRYYAAAGEEPPAPL